MSGGAGRPLFKDILEKVNENAEVLATMTARQCVLWTLAVTRFVEPAGENTRLPAAHGGGRRAWPLLLVLLPPVLAGCGGGPLPTYEAGGTVAFPDGSPLSGGWVEFQPVEAPLSVGARGEIGPDGTFQLTTFEPGDGVIEGEHRALVVPPLPEGDRDETPTPRWVIDPRFFRVETSGLRFTVSQDASENQFDIQVTRPGR